MLYELFMKPSKGKGTMKNVFLNLRGHPNIVIAAITLASILIIGIGASFSTDALERRLMEVVFLTNDLTSRAVAFHLKDYLEGRANGIRSLANVLGNERSFEERNKDIDAYYSYLKSEHVRAMIFISEQGRIVYSTDSSYIGRDFRQTSFWKYVLKARSDAANPGFGSHPSGLFGSIVPYAGEESDGDYLLVGMPIFRERGAGPFEGAVALIINQFQVVGAPLETLSDLDSSTSRVTIGLFTRDRFPFVHIWSNAPTWNLRGVGKIRRVGKSVCASCHDPADIDQIFGRANHVGTTIVRDDSLPGGKGKFVWTSYPLTTSRLELRDSVWNVVVGVDKKPVASSIYSYLKTSLFFVAGTVILLAIALSLSFYGHRRRLLDEKEIDHLKQVSDLREKYEVLVKKSNDGIYILSDTKIVFANKKLCEILGYTPEETIGLDISAITAQESMGQIGKRIESLRRGEEVEPRYVFMALAKTGRKIPVEISVSHIEREGAMQTIGIMRDLSELTEKKQLYEELFESAPIGLSIYKNFKSVRINYTGARMLGYRSPQELIGKPVYEIVHPDDLPAVKERVQQAMLDRVPASPLEEKFLRKDGSVIHVLVLSRPVTYEGEDAVQVAFVSLEDRKKLEENLTLEAVHQEEEKIRLDTLLQNLEEGILFQNPGREIEFANTEFCRIFGFQNSLQVTGKLSKDVLIQAARRLKSPVDFINQVSRDVEEKAAVKMNRLEMADGSIVERSALPIFDSSGKYIGRLSVFRDVTLREKNEEAIKRLQRTELLGRLAGGIAHDFNNVLGIIIGSLQMILRKNDNPNVVQENSKRALSSAIRGSEVAKRLLQFVRYSPEGFKVFSVKQIIEETVSIIKHTFEENINIHEELMIQDAFIYGSPGDIQQVLINLANNSRDAMPGGGNLTYSLTLAEKKEVERKLGSSSTNPYVLLKVQDSGKGIEEDKLEKIFDPFFTTKEMGKGTGLGLSIVQTIISAHGGLIEVKSRVGEGTAFYIYLPMNKDRLSQPISMTQGEVEHSIEDIKTKTVLIVEDEADLRELLIQYLSDKGINVVCAGDGEEGCRVFENHPEISIVISDLGLPKLPGDELIVKIKAIRPDVKCILATGYLTPAAGDTLSDLEVKTIMKPYNLSAIYNLVAEASLDKT